MFLENSENNTSSKEVSFDVMTFQEFQDEHKIDPFYYDLAGDLLTPYRLLYEYGPWIAGGFFTRSVQGETLQTFNGDIDIWFNTNEQKEEYKNDLDTNRFRLNAIQAPRYKSHYSYSYIIPYK